MEGQVVVVEYQEEEEARAAAATAHRCRVTLAKRLIFVA